MKSTKRNVNRSSYVFLTHPAILLCVLTVEIHPGLKDYSAPDTSTVNVSSDQDTR